MSKVHVQSERIVAARPEEVYAALADYRLRRPQMLTPNFIDYKVEQGGHGDGTVISYRLHAANRERPYRLRVEEAVPGHVLLESDLDSSLVTTWSVAGLKDGLRTLVRVNTEWEGSRGVGGFFERTFAPLGLKSIYARMLELLTFIVQSDEKRSVSMEDESTVSERFGVFFLIFGIVMGVAFGISYLRKAQNQ